MYDEWCLSYADNTWQAALVNAALKGLNDIFSVDVWMGRSSFGWFRKRQLAAILLLCLMSRWLLHFLVTILKVSLKLFNWLYCLIIFYWLCCLRLYCNLIFNWALTDDHPFIIITLTQKSTEVFWLLNPYFCKSSISEHNFFRFQSGLLVSKQKSILLQYNI